MAPADDALPRPSAAGPPPHASGTIAFQSDRDGRTKIYLLDVETGDVRALTHGPDHHDEAPAWSPDGRFLAFSTTRFDGRTYDLAVARADGTDVRRITTDLAWDRAPSWAADGLSLFFARDGSGPTAIHRVWLDDGRVERVSATPDRAVMPAASPDGRLIAYAVATLHGFQLFVTDLDTRRERQLTSADDGATHPSWTRDGRGVVFTRPGSATRRLDLLSVDQGTHDTLIAEPDTWIEHPSMSPDGGWIAFALRTPHEAGEGWNLAVVDAAGAGPIHIVTSGPANDRAPVWKP